MAPMHSHYQHHATSYANVSLASAHAIINDLHRRAAKLAPRFAEETAEAQASNTRPGDESPRRQQVWDMLAESLGWNLIADDTDAVVAAKTLEANGRPYQVGFAWNQQGNDRSAHYQQPFVVDLNGAEFLTYEALRALQATVAKGTSVVTLDCTPTGRHGRDGRDYLNCGSIANPAGYCCEHGTYVGPQPQVAPETPEVLCRHCNEPIELVGRNWVHVLSGDEGGTYDWCDDSPNRRHEREVTP